MIFPVRAQVSRGIARESGPKGPVMETHAPARSQLDSQASVLRRVAVAPGRRAQVAGDSF